MNKIIISDTEGLLYFVGCLYSLLPVMLIDLFRIEMFVPSFGVSNFSFGIGSLAAGPLTSMQVINLKMLKYINYRWFLMRLHNRGHIEAFKHKKIIGTSKQYLL